MPDFDGSIIVDTEIDAKGIQRDTKKVEKAAREAGAEVESIGDSFREAERDADRAASGIEDELDKLEDELDKLKDELDKLKVSINEVGDAISTGFAADMLMELGSGLMDMMSSTEELRGDLSMLDQNARMAGMGLETAREAMQRLNTVSGETDSSIEAVSNLLAAGVPENRLQQAVEGLANAAISFPDTIKIESLADSLQETLATGEATGQFAEVLDRIGYSAEVFNQNLAMCTTEAQKQELALNILTQGPLKGVYEGWAAANPELVKGRDVTLELEEATAELATTISPVLTKLTEMATSAVNWVSGMDNIDDVFTAIIGGVAALGAVKAMDTIKGLATSLMSVDKAMLMTKASTGLAFVAFGLLFTLLLKAAGVWDSMNDAEKITVILGAITVAAFAAALAVGAFQSALSLGVAVALIAGGVAAMILAINSAEQRVKELGSSVTQSLDPSSYSPKMTGIPALATGAVIPPNGEFLAVLGDQKNGRNLEAPEGLIRQIVREEGGGARALHIYLHKGGGFMRDFKFSLDEEAGRQGMKLTEV